MAPKQIQETKRSIEDTDLWKFMFPKMVERYENYDLDDYDGDRDELNDDFHYMEGNRDEIVDLWFVFEGYENDIINMIKKDCLIIQNWIYSVNDDYGFDEIPFEKINTERKIFLMFMYFLCDEIKIVE